MNKITNETLELIKGLITNEECGIELSRDNRYIARIKKDGKLRYIGSKYSVKKDIQEFFCDIGIIDEYTIIIVFGLGTGEHLKHLLCNLSNNNKVFIVEPSSSIINQMLKQVYCKDILMDDRVALCYLNHSLKKHMNNFIEDYNVDNVKIMSFSNYDIIFETEYKTLVAELNSVKTLKKMGNNTLNIFSDLFFNNFIENIFSLDEFYTVNYLKNKFKDKPAIIVSAGPSLNKNIHLLKNAQDKFIIISGPRTLGILINNGIKPDFLCEVDPQEEVYNFVKDYIDFNIPLVFMDSSCNKLVKEQKGLKVITANQGMEKYLEDMLGIKIDSLMQGGSVAHFCMGLAVYLGCNSIIFIGQDLAYTNERFQADGTYAGEIDKLKYRYEDDKEQWDKDKNQSIYVKDIHGNMIRTSSVLNAYREEFEELIEGCSQVSFINSTEGGVSIKGTKVMTLEDSITQFGLEFINKNLTCLLDKPILIDEDKFIEKILKILNQLEVIKNASEEGIKYSYEMLCFYKENRYCNLNKIFEELDKVDTIINNKEKIGFFAYKLVTAISKVLENKEFRAKENETEKELGIRLANKSLEMYRSTFTILEDLNFMINEKFIYLNQCNTLNKVFLKKNLNKYIENIYKSYDNLKEIDIVDSVNLNNRLIRYRKVDDGSFLFLHKITERIENDKIKILFGSSKINEESISIYHREDLIKDFGILNHSLVLLKNKPINKEDTLFIKLRKNKKTNLYLRFIDKKHLSLYEDIRKGLKNLDGFIESKLEYFDLFFESNMFGYAIEFENTTLYKNTIISSLNEEYNNSSEEEEVEIEILVDTREGMIFLNDKIIRLDKYIVERYIYGNYCTICSNTLGEYCFKYDIEIAELGTPRGALTLNEKVDNILTLSQNNNFTIYNNELQLNSLAKIYKMYDFKGE